MDRMTGHCGSVKCAAVCACECPACNAVRLRAKERAAKDQAEADWQRHRTEKAQAELDLSEDTMVQRRAAAGRLARCVVIFAKEHPEDNAIPCMTWAIWVNLARVACGEE